MSHSSFKLNVYGARGKSMPSWFFPKSNGGEEQGLNDSGVSTFKRAESLGRETCQNIGDVRDESGAPAIATFELVHLPAAEFPGREEFIRIFEACRDYVLEGLPDGTGNEGKFFERALEVLDRDTIPVLRIGDENTTGLVGSDDDRSKAFYRLLKLQGASSAQGVGGGTYGIGQRAPFAHSSLRTVLYSTKTPEGQAFIAKTVLASFPLPGSGEMTQSKGWWCNIGEEDKDWRTIRKTDEIPTRFKRNTIGTDLWVAGFLTEDWEQSIRHSVLQHFFAAIENRQIILQLMVDGKVQTRISADNLKEELIKAADEARKILSTSEHRKGLGATIYYHKALTEPYGGKPFEKKINKIGTVKLYLYRDIDNSDMPDRWTTMRKPRIIVEHYGSGLLSRFAAVLVCDNDEGNGYLAQLEDQTHERWDEEETRNWNDAQKREAKQVINEIKRFVKETLKVVRGDCMKEQEDIPFLGRYLPAEDDEIGERSTGAAEDLSGCSTEDETGEKRTRDETAPVSGVARKREQSSAIKNKQLPSSGKGKRGDESGESREGTGEAAGDNGGAESAGEGVENSVLSPEKVRFRSYRIASGYRVILQSDRDLMGDLKIHAVGEDSDYLIDLVSANNEATSDQFVINKSTITNVVLPEKQIITLNLNINSDIDLCLAMGGS